MINVTKPFLPPKEEYDRYLQGIWQRNWITNHGLTGEDPVRMGTGNSILFPLRVFETRTKPIYIAGTNDAFWKVLCRALGCEEWLADPRFATNAARCENVHLLKRLIEAERVAHMFLVPAMILFMLQSPKVREGDYRTLQLISYGGSPISDRVLTDAMATFGCSERRNGVFMRATTPRRQRVRSRRVHPCRPRRRLRRRRGCGRCRSGWPKGARGPAGGRGGGRGSWAVGC